MTKKVDMAVDCLTFLHTVDSRKLHKGDILWTPVFKFDPPTDYRVRGRVTLEDRQWKIQLIPLLTQNLERLACPVRFTWTLSVVNGRKSQVQDRRDVPCEKIKKVFDNAHNDYDIIDSIGVSKDNIKIHKMADANGSVTFMWYVELFLDHSLTSEVTTEEEAERRQTVVQRPDTGKQERENSDKMPTPGFDTEVKWAVSNKEHRKDVEDGFQDGRVNSSTLSSPKQKIDILLIGKTGHGKSSTGNSILRRNIFKTSSKGTSVTNDIHVALTDVGETTIKVVDGPGIEDNILESAEATQKACDDMAKAMSVCPEGFHALLLVFKFRHQFTREDENCIAILKTILGPNTLRDYCVIVITFGELFDLEEQNEDFSVWLSKQESALKNILNECNYRCVLMRNKTKDENVKETQLRQLMQIILSVKHRDVRYNKEGFDSVQQERKKEEEVEELNRILSQTMENDMKEEEQNWQDILNKVNNDHDQQMKELQSQYESMQAMDAEIMKFMKNLSGQLRRLPRPQLPPRDPNQVTLHCRDQESRTLSVTLPRTSPIKPLMDGYCSMTGCPYDKLKFQLDGVEVKPEHTPADLQVANDATIGVQIQSGAEVRICPQTTAET